MAVRLPNISAACHDLLLDEFVAYMLRNHDDDRAGREELAHKLEHTGFEIGRRVTERLLRDRGERMTDPLDIVKWMCREFWSEVFRKPVDKLQTNNRGTFVLQDFAFRWTRAASAPPSDAAGSGAFLLKYMLLPCGVVRGALSAFNLVATVNVDVSAAPRVVFHVRVAVPAGASASPPPTTTSAAATTAAAAAVS